MLSSTVVSLISKFDRSYYTILRQYHTQQSQLIKQGVIPKTTYESETESIEVTNTQASTSTDLVTTESYEQVDQRGEKILNSDILQILKEEYIQSYGNRTQLSSENIEVFNATNYNDDFTEEDESTIGETEQALFSSSVNREDHRLHETIVFSSDNNSSNFSVSDDDEENYFPNLENIPTKAEVETLELTGNGNF